MFDTTLVASNRRREVKRKLATLPAALAVHAMALGFVMVGQLWAVGGVVEPEVMEAYVDVQLPTPPPAPPAVSESEESANQEPPAAPEPVQITSVPSEPAKAGPPEAPGARNTVPGGDPTGGGNGVIPGGVPDRNVSPPPPPPQAPLVYTLETVTTRPIPRFRPSPVYPESARRARIEGTVLIHAVVDEVGDVVDVRLIDKVPMGCSEAALDAVRSWKYEAATLRGKSVKVQLEIRVTFRLSGAS